MLAVLALAACADGGKRADFPSEWEQKNARLLAEPVKDTLPPPPPWPQAASLLPFEVSPSGDFRYFVDKDSISVSGNEVRYTVIARSTSGAENVSFEALNCHEREFRSIARGAAPGEWIVHATPWRRVEPRIQVAQYALHREYLCPNNTAVASPGEAVAAFRAGGHPLSRLPTGGR